MVTLSWRIRRQPRQISSDHQILMNNLNATGQLGKPLGISALLGAALVLSSNSTFASLTYMTPAGASVPSNGSVDASANITLGNGTVTVTLTDLLQNPTSSGQTLSGIEFTVSGATSMATLASSSGYESTINTANGPLQGTYTPGTYASPLSHWGANNAVNLSTIGIVGHMPYDLIVGPDSAGSLTGLGKYSNANQGFGNFNPYVLGSATFVLNVSGVTPTSTLSGVVFDFGTQPAQVPAVISTSYSAVPEPGMAGVLVGCLNLLPLGACLVRRLHNKQTPKS
jgi:hypothetical protein